MSTGFDLKMRRLQAGMKQYELAGQLGLSPQFVSQVELGRKPAPPDFEQRYLEVVADRERRMRDAGLLPGCETRKPGRRGAE